MAESDAFHTAVRGITGIWPPTPAGWSYSSLKDAEECPRRWMLSRATYPSVWQRGGYPPRPIIPALVGDVVHRSLELILRRLQAHRCATLADPCAVAALRELGGYSKVVERAIDERLQRLDGNPRMAGRLADLRAALRVRVPDMRHRVQAVITRTAMTLSPFVELESSNLPQRGPLGPGSYPEVELHAPDLRFSGRIDLLTLNDVGCTITDYKTGAPDPHHADQLKTYALLWRRDAQLNPLRLPVESLALAYATHDEMIEPPTDSELAALAEHLVGRAAQVEGKLRLRPPPAYPASPMCGVCSVRHLCDDYWAARDASVQPTALSQGIDFVDCEAVVVGQSGPRSWLVAVEPDGVTALLRTRSETTSFRDGDRVRVLDVAQGLDEDAGRTTLTLTNASEVFVLVERT